MCIYVDCFGHFLPQYRWYTWEADTTDNLVSMFRNAITHVANNSLVGLPWNDHNERLANGYN